MESPSTIRLATSLCCICVLLSFTATVINPVVALENCKFPAIFNFADSNSDTGGYAAAFSQPPWPYGRTFFRMPAGRFSDGRLMIDFIGGFSPFYLGLQYDQFVQFKSRTLKIRKRGGVYKDLMPKEEYFPKALYTLDIGQNDLGEGFFANMSIQEVNATVPDIINGFSTNVRRIYKSGARSFWIHNTGPIGCLPYILANFQAAQRDSAGCSKPHNEVAQYFNYKLKEAVSQLRKDFPLAAITYVDVYSVKYSLFSQPKKYGFELPLVACCGYGGEYNYGNDAGCGSTITVNGSQIFVGSCERPSLRVNWDGIHYTEAANKFVFDQISSGAFSDPPLPLRMACHRNTSY